MSWHFSQALVAEYSAGNCSGGKPSAPSNGTHTHGMFWSPDKTTDASKPSRSGMTYAPSTGGHGADVLTWYLEASPAKTSVSQETAMDSKASEAACGNKWQGSWVKWDRDTSSWKTHQLSLLGGLEPFLETWPKWGIMLDGECYTEPTLEQSTNGRESGLLPTPCAQDWQPICWARAEKLAQGLRGREKNAKGGCANLQDSLAAAWLMERKLKERPERGKMPRANPCYWEYLMELPSGWTDCAAPATANYQAWLRSHGSYCMADEESDETPVGRA